MTRRLDKHIAVTPHGYRARIRIHGVIYQRRFKQTVELVKVKEWLLTTEMKYRRGSSQDGAFHLDARRYLDTVTAMPTYAQRVQHIEEWIAVFRDQPRETLTSAQITAQLHRWRTEPRILRTRAKPGQPPKERALVLSASAVNKRRAALMHLFSVLDGKSARNPVKDTPKFQEPAPAPRGIPFVQLKALFAAMPASASRARLMVMAYTGIPPAQIKLITEADVNFDARTVAVTGRRKGRGTAGRIVPLTPDGVRAFKAMQREDAWGPFTGPPLRRAFQRGCVAADIGSGFVPYDLRHAFGTEVYRRSGDIRATQLLMDHSSPTLTHRYTVGAEDARVAAAIATFSAKRSARVSSRTKR